MVDSVEETEVSQNENTNKEPESGKAEASSTPGNPAAQAGGSSAFGGQFSTIFAGGPSFVPPVATPVTGLSQSLPACLMPESFNGSGDFEDYLGQFNTAAYLSGWYRPCSHDYRPQYFALRLKGNALHFYSTLSEDHHDDFDLLVEAFRQNYTTNVEILKARLKAARQQPGQDIATFLCDIRTLARRAYRDHPRLLEQIVVTSFIEGLNNSTLRWELRKLKPENADHALTKALELQAYLELEGRNPIGTANSGSAGVNHMTNQFLTDNTALFDEFVRSLKRDADNMPHNHNRGSRDNSRSRERDRNSSMDRRTQNDSRENTRSRYENDTRDNRNTYMPSRNRQDNRDDSRQRYGQRYDSSERRPEQQNRSVRFESPRNDRGQNRQNINFNSRNAQNRPQSPYQNRRHDFNSNPGQRSNNYTTRSQDQACTHCRRTNHTSRECKACFNCLKIGHFRHECRAPKSSNLN